MGDSNNLNETQTLAFVKNILTKYAYTEPNVAWVTPDENSLCELVVSNISNTRLIGLATEGGRAGFLFELSATGEVICKDKSKNFTLVSPIPAEAFSALPALGKIQDYVDKKYAEKLAQEKALAEKEASDALKPLLTLIERNANNLVLLIQIQQNISKLNSNPKVNFFLLADNKISLEIGTATYTVNYKTKEVTINSSTKENEYQKIDPMIINQVMGNILATEKNAKDEAEKKKLASQQLEQEKQNSTRNLFNLLGEQFRSNLPTNATPMDEDRKLTRFKIEQLINQKRLNVQELKNAKHDTHGFGLIHAAISANNLEVAQFLISLGVNPNIRSSTNNTALHQAAFNNHYQLIIDLIQNGADAKILNNKVPGESALDNISTTTPQGKAFLNQVLGLILDREIKSKFGISEFTINHDGNLTYTHPTTKQKISVPRHEINQLFNDAVSAKFQTSNSFDIALNQSSFHISKVPQEVKLPEDRVLSYTEWLDRKYGIIARSERNSLNTTKETGINYIFRDPSFMQGFGNQFCDKTKHSKNLLIYDPVYNNKPAILLEGNENQKLQDSYKAYLNQAKQKHPRSEEAILNQIKAIDQSLNNIAIVQKIDIAPTMNSRIQFNQSGEHRLDAFQKLANEEKDGYTISKASSAYKLSIEAFIALNQDTFSETEHRTLKKASINLMGDGADVSSGLKADANWIEYIQQHPGAENSKLYNVADAIRKDADDLLNGNPRRRIVDVSMDWEMKSQADVGANQDHMRRSLLNNMNVPLSEQNQKVRNIPRFFPDANGKSDTDSIILQSGGMIDHSTMVKIWKQGVSITGQPVKDNEVPHHYKFYRTEFNAGAGTKSVDWKNGTCESIYTTEIKPCWTKEGNMLPAHAYPNPATNLKRYNEVMESTIKELIINEREILFYRQTQKGPNGEVAAETVEEGKEWTKRNQKIALLNQTKVPSLCHKGILQRTGNCSIASQKQLVRGEFIFNHSNSSIVEEQWAFAQTHNKANIVSALENKKLALQTELLNTKTLAVKEILEMYAKTSPNVSLINPVKNSNCELVISNTPDKPIGLATSPGRSGFLFELNSTGTLICKDKTKNFQIIDPIPAHAFSGLPPLAEIKAFVQAQAQTNVVEQPLSQAQKQVIADFTNTHNTTNLLQQFNSHHHQPEPGIFTQFNGDHQNHNETKVLENLGKKVHELNNQNQTTTTIETAIDKLDKDIDSSAKKHTPQKQKNDAPPFGKSAFKETIAALKEGLQNLKRSLGLKSKVNAIVESLPSIKKVHTKP